MCHSNPPVAILHVHSFALRSFPHDYLVFAGDQTDCAVYAWDGLGNDVSSAIAYVTSNPTCTPAVAGDVRCPLCAVQYMQQGLCLPGRYKAEACLYTSNACLKPTAQT